VRRATNDTASSTAPAIGPAGVTARATVGATLVALELIWRDPKWSDALVALGLAGVISGFMTARARRMAAPLDASGPLAHALSVLAPIPLLLVPATSGGALLFYGGSMLLAAWRRNGGCEVTVASNALLGRADQLGCALFAPVDAVERSRRSDLVARAPADG
jgi:hypothetical protein